MHIWDKLKDDVESGWIIFKEDMEAVRELAFSFRKEKPVSTAFVALLGTPICFSFIFPAAALGLILSMTGYYRLMNYIFKKV